jgi:hypothetical protein
MLLDTWFEEEPRRIPSHSAAGRNVIVLIVAILLAMIIVFVGTELGIEPPEIGPL